MLALLVVRYDNLPLPTAPRRSLADRIHEEAVRLLGLPYRSKRWDKACKTWVTQRQRADADVWVPRACQIIKENVDDVTPDRVERSAMNWQLRRTETVPSPDRDEVLLERNFLYACPKTAPWWNQMATASGLLRSSADRSMKIDLVHGRAEGQAFDFIELKVDSDNPLYAAVEALRYGFLWLHIRNRGFYASRPVMQASQIRLGVLGPERYYQNVDPTPFEQGANRALAKVGDEHGVRLSLRFARFSRDFDARKISQYDGPTLLKFFGQAWPDQ